ncbi:hypothetical protein B0H67DRAFT_538438 [Lasiosphaeris hirsuta]|uniref:Uncharacterized protein n=1 Tax=Lasiosphaeris hirsuta TaxID=260670 RepID=A0AA40AH96_9PEZI|nr:hypothetical protein B0H67DRAFT_538438 [Lasiosphaeris hirsuta]
MASITSRPPPPPPVSPSAASTSVSALSASTMPTSVESKSENDPQTVRFTNVQDLFDVINSTTGDFLTVLNVTPSHFTEIERGREKRHRKFRFRRYSSNSQILIITIPTDLHEALHLGLYEGYRDQLVKNNKKRSWKSIGTATFRQQGHPRGDGGEGDSTGGPKPERVGAGKWPTLVIEAGDSETLGELHNDMRWWFRTSNHQVKIVILTKFDHQQHHILIEKWEEEISHGLLLYCSRVVFSVKRQPITITRDKTINLISYNVTRGALVLGFRFLFLRDPGPQEGDFILSIQDLQLYAEVWAEVRD